MENIYCTCLWLAQPPLTLLGMPIGLSLGALHCKTCPASHVETGKPRPLGIMRRAPVPRKQPRDCSPEIAASGLAGTGGCGERGGCVGGECVGGGCERGLTASCKDDHLILLQAIDQPSQRSRQPHWAAETAS